MTKSHYFNCKKCGAPGAVQEYGNLCTDCWHKKQNGSGNSKTRGEIYTDPFKKKQK